jgi:hypothetical protein
MRAVIISIEDPKTVFSKLWPPHLPLRIAPVDHQSRHQP